MPTLRPIQDLPYDSIRALSGKQLLGNKVRPAGKKPRGKKSETAAENVEFYDSAEPQTIKAITILNLMSGETHYTGSDNIICSFVYVIALNYFTHVLTL